MLTAAELAMMRSTQSQRFDLTATVSRPNGTTDNAGGALPSAPTTFDSACCRTPHKSALGEEVEAGAIQGKGLWDITFPALTDARLQDQITIGSQSYEVVKLDAPKSRETARVVLCVER